MIVAEAEAKRIGFVGVNSNTNGILGAIKAICGGVWVQVLDTSQGRVWPMTVGSPRHSEQLVATGFSVSCASNGLDLINNSLPQPQI